MDALKKTTVTFEGYLRVWNEEHHSHEKAIAPTSETEAGAKVLTEALEFFVYGRAKKPAVRNRACQPEKTP